MADDVVRLENSHIVATVSAATGVLQEISLKDSGVAVKTDLRFVRYGTRSGKERSGAYLFLPDGDAKVRANIVGRGALYRAKAGYSHRTFPSTIR